MGSVTGSFGGPPPIPPKAAKILGGVFVTMAPINC